MYGAILGDIIGQPYEFAKSQKTKDFSLFTNHPKFTDDSVMTVAICGGVLTAGFDADEKTMKQSMIEAMHKWGNGSAMRVSSVGWFFQTLERTREVARWSAEVTHNHPEGVKGAEAVASVIWMARKGSSKEEIKTYVEKEFGYDLSKSCDEIRPEYYFDVSCQGTVPQAITAFLEGTDFEDVIRTAVSLGGDCDTLTCIAGGMAEAFYGVPDFLKEKCLEFTTKDMHKVLERFEKGKEKIVE